MPAFSCCYLIFPPMQPAFAIIQCRDLDTCFQKASKFCLNGCNGRGECTAGFCYCKPGAIPCLRKRAKQKQALPERVSYP